MTTLPTLSYLGYITICAGLCACVILKGVPTAPDDHGEDEKCYPGDLGFNRSRQPLHVEAVPEDKGTSHLHEPVEEIVEGAGTGAEVGTVDVVELVGVEPVGGPEHGEKEDDPGILLEGLD